MRYGSVRMPRITSQHSNGDGTAPAVTCAWRIRPKKLVVSRARRSRPPRMSLWPPRYFVVACITRSAPSCERTLQHGRCPGVVARHARGGAARDGHHRRDVGDANPRVGRRLDPEQARVRPHRGLDGRRVRHVDQRRLETPRRRSGRAADRPCRSRRPRARSRGRPDGATAARRRSPPAPTRTPPPPRRPRARRDTPRAPAWWGCPTGCRRTRAGKLPSGARSNVVERWMGGVTAPVFGSMLDPAWTASVSMCIRRRYQNDRHPNHVPDVRPGCRR